ncbi:sensor histidine kinase [Haloglomus litoreum]|uniref:sensor histidine kinase n=1 Tax=Haloglomus litoreum TaxID=3034026 RepID=UPI0023E7D2FB|nr:PAS domain-containing sensor histidine kinase [Haloglomus sp. DT116]
MSDDSPRDELASGTVEDGDDPRAVGAGHLLALADRLDEVIWVMRADFSEVLYVNRAFEELWGYSRREMSDSIEGHLDAIHPEDRDDVREAMAQQAAAVADGRDEEVHYDFRLRRDDQVRWIESVAFSIQGGMNHEPAIGGISRDVTERVRRERRLQEQVERLDQATSFITHDLRNPLNVAQGRLEQYRATADPENLDAVAEAIDRIEAITTDMLELVSLESSDEPRRPVDVGTIARRAWNTVDTREAELVVVDDVTVMADASHLRSLLENLIRNAVGHGGDDVTVRVGALPGGAGFYLEDSGRGIPEPERESALEHGYSTGYSGTGTGLTIVRRVAEAHGWDMSLAESAEGGLRVEFGHESGATADGGVDESEDGWFDAAD